MVGKQDPASKSLHFYPQHGLPELLGPQNPRQTKQALTHRGCSSKAGRAKVRQRGWWQPPAPELSFLI